MRYYILFILTLIYSNSIAQKTNDFSQRLNYSVKEKGRLYFSIKNKKGTYLKSTLPDDFLTEA